MIAPLRGYFLFRPTELSKKFTLGKNERLKSRKRIEEIFQKGKKISVPPFRALYMKNDAIAALQFSAGVSSRNFKKAVDRNRIKRLMREAWRVQKNNLKLITEDKASSLFVFITYNGKELPDYKEVHDKMGKLIGVLTEQLSL